MSFHPVEHLTSSFGATAFNAGDDPELILKRVDISLFEAKESGRNRGIRS